MPKLDLAALNASTTLPSAASQDHYLFMLGTGTEYVPLPTTTGATAKHYENGETLSYLAQLLCKMLGETPTLTPSAHHSFSAPSVDVVNGPDNLGKEVGNRIVEGLSIALKAIFEGKTKLHIAAHSRGAVETVLIVHELERIKNELKNTALPPKPFKVILSESPCPYTKAAVLAAGLQGELDAPARAKLLANLEAMKIDLFLMDPVPGDGPALTGIGWDDVRFHIALPQGVSAQLYFSRDERSAYFYPIRIKGLTPVIVPGHHGTASGNFYSQQYEALPQTVKNQNTSLVQQFMICKYLESIHERISAFSAPGAISSINLGHSKLDELVNKFLPKLNAQEASQYLLELYDEIFKHNEAYKHFRKTSYAKLWVTNAEGGNRFVHNGSYATTSLAQVVSDIDDANFVNIAHAEAFLRYNLGIGFSGRSKDNLLEAVQDLSKNVQSLFDKYKSSTSSDAEVKTRALLDNPEKRTRAFNAISFTADALSQIYLQNHLPQAIKTDVLAELDTLFRALSQHSQSDTKGIINECYGILRQGLKRTVEKQIDGLVGEAEAFFKRTQDLLITKDDLKQKIAEFIATTQRIENLTPEQADRLSAFVQRLEQSANSGEIKRFFEQASKESRDVLDILEQSVSEQLYKITSYLGSPDDVLKSMNTAYENIEDLIEGASHVETLVKPDSLGINIASLDALKQQLISNAARIFVRYNLSLTEKPDFLSENFYKLLIPHCKAHGPYVSSLEQNLAELKEEVARRDLQAEELTLRHAMELNAAEVAQQLSQDAAEKAHQRAAERLYQRNHKLEQTGGFLSRSLRKSEQSLDAEKERAGRQAVQVQSLTFSRARQEAAIRSLISDKEKQEQLIQGLSLDNERQAQLIASLTTKEEEQATMIEALTSDRKQQGHLIRSLTSDTKRQARLIESLTTDNTKQAQLIQSLTFAKNEQAQLIQLLSADRARQAKLIRSLTSNSAQQAVLIQSLTTDVSQQEQLIKRLQISKKEQLALVKELSKAKAALIGENDELARKVDLLNAQLAKLEEEKKTTASVDDDNELELQLVIKTKLVPLTKEYLLHLAREAQKVVEPSLDISDLPNLVANLKKIQNWSDDKSCQILKKKLDVVSELYDILHAQNKPSVKVGQFYNKLNEADQVLQAYRDPAWKKYAIIALSILATGILPGLIMLAYSSITGDAPNMWQSKGLAFFNSCALDKPRDGLAQAKSPVESSVRLG